MAKGLEIQKPKTPRFYMQPKIRKRRKLWTPSCNFKLQYWHNFNYVDYHLQPILKIIPSYLKDTFVFLCKLKIIANDG